MAKKKTSVTITRAEVEEFIELDARRKEAQRLVESLGKDQKPLKEKLLAFVEQEGGKTKAVIKFGCKVAIESAAGSPAWKQEFINVAGQDAADEVLKNVPPRLYVTAEKVK